MDIQKSSGAFVLYDAEKLKSSLMRAGASQEQALDIIRRITPALHHNMRSKEVFRLAFAQLKKVSRPIATRYNLKKAISELGPSGFPFEQLIARIFQQKGYLVRTGAFFDGRCVTHEVDVVAKKNGETLLMECKFHHTAGVVTNIKTPLYIHARYHDIKLKWPESEAAPHALIATNTRFSEDSIKYSLCAGIQLLSWDFPQGNAIREMIDHFSLYPLTCLNSLTVREKGMLLDKKLVLVRELLDAHDILSNMGIPAQRIKTILEEVHGVC
jgi:hypothetical protein